MPGVSETISLDQFATWAGQRAAALQGASLEVPLKRCKELLVSATRQNFHHGHDPNGVPWLPLRHRAGRPLRDKGLLMASITAGGPGYYESQTDTELIVGTNLDYAAVHQYGATIAREARMRPHPQKPWVFEVHGETIFTRRIGAHTITVPQRPFLGVSEPLAEKMGLVFADWFVERVQKG